MTANNRQWLRRANLIVTEGSQGLDLSQLHFRFDVATADIQSPNHAEIRVYNLSENTARKVRSEYSRVVIQAGYENAAYGVIFNGTIKQFRMGRESATDTYLDILAADGDIGYNFGMCNQSFAAGATPTQVLEYAAERMNTPISYLPPDLRGSNPAALARGKVAFGMSRDIINQISKTAGSSWSIQNGNVQVVPLQGYLPGEAVVINLSTGMIGLPEQTEAGIRVRKLLDPRIKIGATVRLNTRSINRLVRKDSNNPVPFNQWTGIQYASQLAESADGLYRVYVAEHTGDTRSNEWYTDLICLLIDQSSRRVEAQP